MAASTKKLLADTLVSLLEHRPLEKITVKELVETCHVNRQTFYYNFQDIYALVAWIFEGKAGKILAEADPSAQWREMLKTVLIRCVEDRGLILNCYRSVDRRLLERYLKHWIRPEMEKIVDKAAHDAPLALEDRNFIIEMYTLGLMGLALNWLENSMTEEYIKEFDRFVRMIDGSLEDCIKKFCE